MKLLALSNGHGEDQIALQILRQLQQSHGLEVAALPIVGEGHAYRQNQIPIVAPVQVMPSGGFIYMDRWQLVRDLRGGLLSLTWQQLQVVRSWGRQGNLILAVGDIVPLLFAWGSGASYAFVGTAKSDYYLRDEAGPLRQGGQQWLRSASVYHPWERWLMGHPRCKAVFPRDRLTAETLQRWSIPVFDLGNPMMDKLTPLLEVPPQPARRILLLPGSRPPEAYNNWQQILAAISGLLGEAPVLFLGAIAPGLNLEILSQILADQGWQASQGINWPDPQALAFAQGQATLVLTQQTFPECLDQAQIAIAMTGTAMEQFVGLGKPVIIMAGHGPQFTAAFAEAQTRLLGLSVTLVEPAQVPQTVQTLLKQPTRLREIAQNGRRRMGLPGAAGRITECLNTTLLAEEPSSEKFSQGP